MFIKVWAGCDSDAECIINLYRGQLGGIILNTLYQCWTTVFGLLWKRDEVEDRERSVVKEVIGNLIWLQQIKCRVK